MEKNISEKEHSVSLINRSKMTVSGVTDVSEFSDNQVTLKTNMGDMIIKGKKLTINQLNTDDGTLSVNGEIQTVQYTDKGKNGFFSGLFK